VVRLEFNTLKSQENVRKHNISLHEAVAFDWSSAIVRQDKRFDYGEERFLALGYIDETLYALVYTLRDKRIRVISLIKANKKERQRWQEQGL
jgi:uncharacterized protein